jgi:hypothetical protein
MDLTTHEIRRCEAFIVQADQWLVEQPLPTFGQYLASSFCHLLRRIEVLWLMLTTHHKKLIGEFAERLKNKSWTNEYLDCLTTVQIQKLGKKFLYQNKEEPLQAVARATNKADKIALAALFAGNRGVIRNHAQFPNKLRSPA